MLGRPLCRAWSRGTKKQVPYYPILDPGMCMREVGRRPGAWASHWLTKHLLIDISCAWRALNLLCWSRGCQKTLGNKVLENRHGLGRAHHPRQSVGEMAL